MILAGKKALSPAILYATACAKWIAGGQKTGAGYYDYDENRQRNPSKITEEIIADVTGIAAGASGLSQEDILGALAAPYGQ